MLLAAERAAVAAACHRLAAAGLVRGTSGNVSVRTGDLVAVTATRTVLAEVRPEDVAVVGLGGAPAQPGPAPTSELALHLELHRRRGPGAVVHAHPPVATALACVLDELPCVHYDQLALGGAVPVAPYATFGTPQLAAVVLEALGDRPAVLMANHGALVHGPDLATAVDRAELLEWASDVYWRAAAIGSPKTLGRDDLAAVAEALTRRRTHDR